jgi:dephospho-CoA kinase
MMGPMAKRNCLVEGGSGTGKSSVCRELRKRGYKAIDGDNDLLIRATRKRGNEPKALWRFQELQ